jgi:hypothetical protein
MPEGLRFVSEVDEKREDGIDGVNVEVGYTGWSDVEAFAVGG